MRTVGDSAGKNSITLDRYSDVGPHAYPLRIGETRPCTRIGLVIQRIVEHP